MVYRGLVTINVGRVTRSSMNTPKILTDSAAFVSVFMVEVVWCSIALDFHKIVIFASEHCQRYSTVYYCRQTDEQRMPKPTR